MRITYWSYCSAIFIYALPLSCLAASSCGFIPNAPIIEYDFPSLQYDLKFLDVHAKVYRTTLSKGTTPRLRILRYSASPVIEIDDVTQEVLISTKSSNCFDRTPAPAGPRSPTKSPISVPIPKSLGVSLHSSNKFVAPFVTTTLALALANGGLSFTIIGGAIAASLALFLTDGHNTPFAMAALNETCTPSIELVLEAPPYYLGSVDACLAEVENPDHCPLPFPTFKSSAISNPYCKLAVIGAGTGGLYTALRLFEEKKVNGTDICIFEATDRVGGRLYSLRGFGPENDISVDAGGYRTWPRFTVRLIIFTF